VVCVLILACGGAPSASPGSAATPAGSGSGGALASTPVTAGGTPLSTFSTPAPTTAAPAPAATAGASAPRTGGTLHLAVLNEPDALDPARTIQIVADGFNNQVYERLVYVGRDRRPHPWLAEKWDISPDGKQITFTLRKGVKFHDGTDFDAAAVKFEFDRILDPATASPARAQMGTLLSVDVLDPSTVRFNFSDPYAPFFTNISLGYGGIPSPTAVKTHGDAYGHNPVGTGPFRLKQWDAGQRLILERNPDYRNVRDDQSNKGPAHLDAIEWRFIPEAPTRLAALESGELDVSDVDVQQAPRVQADARYQLIVWKDAMNMTFVEYANKPPFTEQAVRQAIASSIDRDSIVKTAWNGFATPNLNPIPVGVAGWDPSLGQQYGYPYDLGRARRYLADAGYAPGADGVLEKDGQRLAFTLLVYSGTEPGKSSAEVIQSALNSIGMQVDLQIMEYGALTTLLKAGKFDADWMRWTWPDPVIESLLWKSPGWTNQMLDPELDELATAADTQLDPTRRLEAVQAVQRYILQKAYVAPIATDWIIVAANARVKGYEWDAIGYPMLVDVSLTP
jgi:peptide/nickel transport system substrate-binding protein